jgi:hypothetical protein
MIMWIATRLGITKGAAIGGVVALIGLAGVVAYFILTSQIDKRVDDARSSGAIEERATQSGKVVIDVQKANDAVTHRDPARDKRLCDKDSRTPANCE